MMGHDNHGSGKFSAKFLMDSIPEVDITAGPTANGAKLIFAETVDKYTRSPSVNQSQLEDIVRNKIGKYATQVWYDKYLLQHPRISFLEAFKERWIRLMDSDDFNKLIQGYEFRLEKDALQMGLAYEQEFRPFMELATNDHVKRSAEDARVARFRKILGGTLMAQLIQRHPDPFTTVDEMLIEIKRLNDALGIAHYAHPAESPHYLMGISLDTDTPPKITATSAQGPVPIHIHMNGTEIQANHSAPKNTDQQTTPWNRPKKPMGMDKGWTSWNKPSKPYVPYSARKPETDTKPKESQPTPQPEIKPEPQPKPTPTTTSQQPYTRPQSTPPIITRPQTTPQPRIQPTSNPQPSSQPTRQSNPPQPRPQTTNQPRTDNPPTDPDVSNRACYRCDEKGHLSRDCPLAQKIHLREINRRVCTKCTRRGHYSKDCPGIPEPQNFPVSDGRQHQSGETQNPPTEN